MTINSTTQENKRRKECHFVCVLPTDYLLRCNELYFRYNNANESKLRYVGVVSANDLWEDGDRVDDAVVALI